MGRISDLGLIILLALVALKTKGLAYRINIIYKRTH